MPAIEIAALALVLHGAGHWGRLPRLVDLFCMGCGAWSVWLVGISIIVAAVPPAHVFTVFFGWLEVGGILVLLWSAYVDYCFFHPLVFGSDENAAALRAFNARGTMAAIGDTDFHIGQFGMARTYVFARERSAESIIEAVRARRTVVYDRGRAYGDAALVELAAEDGRVPRMAAEAGPRRLGTIDGAVGIAGLIAAILFGFREPGQDEGPRTIE